MKLFYSKFTRDLASYCLTVAREHHHSVYPAVF